MAQYYDAAEVSKRIHEQLKIIKWKSIEKGKSFMIELPIHLYFNYQRLRLYIYPVDDGETFIEFSNDTEYYYNLFNEQDKNYHYEIQLDNNHLYKKFYFNHSVIAAINEFIKYFVYLNDFMQKNDIV